MLDGERIAPELIQTAFEREEVFQNVAMHVKGERLIHLNRTVRVQVPTQIHRRFFRYFYFTFIFPHENIKEEPTKPQEEAVEMQPFFFGVGKYPTALYAVGSDTNHQITQILTKRNRDGSERYCPTKAGNPARQKAGDTVRNAKLDRP